MQRSPTDVNPLHHSAKCWLICEKVVIEKKEKRKDITYYTNDQRNVEVNILCGIDIFPNYFQCLNHFAFIDVKWVIHMAHRPVQHHQDDLAMEFWFGTLR